MLRSFGVICNACSQYNQWQYKWKCFATLSPMSECAMNIQMYVWLANQIDLVSMNDSQKEKKQKRTDNKRWTTTFLLCIFWINLQWHSEFSANSEIWPERRRLFESQPPDQSILRFCSMNSHNSSAIHFYSICLLN